MDRATNFNASNEGATLTSYCQLFGRPINNQLIREIEIPLIQRDYAQGRPGESVERIRKRFLSVLGEALQQGAAPVDLDFVYGDVTQDGKFYPLDGQQRLTTLFLLHWYVACRAGIDVTQAPWSRFSYATRHNARDFCEFLVKSVPVWTACEMKTGLSIWLQDQIGYFLTWKHDPTIQSMLVMLDDLHEMLKNSIDFSLLWQRLVDDEHPAIHFHLLPMAENGLTDNLYIKMNSRGKPLTEFENFKAHFEGMLKRIHPGKVNEFARKVDNAWTDVLWEYRGDDFLIDDEFMCYFRFVTDVCAWDNGIFAPDTPIEDLADQVYSGTNLGSIDFLLRAFDVWVNPNGGQEYYVKKVFGALFTLDPAVSVSTALRLFNVPGSGKSVDLFSSCCCLYGSNQWSYGNTLLLYAVLQYKIAVRFDNFSENLPEFQKRLRIVRNLIEASNDELALRERDAGARIKNLVSDVRRIILHGDLLDLSSRPGFNKVQIADEIQKQEFLRKNPALEQTLFTLEDHELLRGGLSVFTLDPSNFVERTVAFTTLFDKEHWPDVTGALLSKGQEEHGYARKWSRGEGAYLSMGSVKLSMGSVKNAQPWQVLFRRRLNEDTHPTNQALMDLLDEFHVAQCNVDALTPMQQNYWQNENTPKDWRYYFVKYPIMRSAPQGVYVLGKSRFRGCMLKGERVTTFWDPYLLALVEKAGYTKTPTHFSPPSWPHEFYGTQDEAGPRPIKLAASGITIECVAAGWQLGNSPEELSKITAFEQICEKYSIDTDLLLTVQSNGNGIDSIDRVELGAELLKDLIAL